MAQLSKQTATIVILFQRFNEMMKFPYSRGGAMPAGPTTAAENVIP
jgi:hypothetical protein